VGIGSRRLPRAGNTHTTVRTPCPCELVLRPASSGRRAQIYYDVVSAVFVSLKPRSDTAKAVGSRDSRIARAGGATRDVIIVCYKLSHIKKSVKFIIFSDKYINIKIKYEFK